METQKLSTKIEFKIIEGVLSSVKLDLSIDEEILRSQKVVWLRSIPVKNETQRTKIVSAVEKHHHVPAKWITDDTMEIIIDPDQRLYKKAATA